MGVGYAEAQAGGSETWMGGCSRQKEQYVQRLGFVTHFFIVVAVLVYSIKSPPPYCWERFIQIKSHYD
jgi:hypothetical protein